ncbi:MAG: InlB B-repeat-containing protein [Desulfobulbaceae bacterium]
MLILALYLPQFLPIAPVQAADGGFGWAKAMGGASTEGGDDLFVDTSGNVYITGSFEGTADFDPGPGTFNLTSLSIRDIFISKLDSSGNFLWAKAIGGYLSYSTGNSNISVDPSGNIYITSMFGGTFDFDPGAGTFYLTSAGESDIFILKLNSSGNFVWARSMGGANYDGVSGISADTSGNVYTTGSFFGTVDFDPGPGTFNLTSSATEYDMFISKLDNDGNFVWARSMGGSSSGISLDTSGNVYTTGGFTGTVDFDPGAGTFFLTSAGGGDIFISKLDSGGNFVWAKAMGSTTNDRGEDITVDTSGKVYASGIFQGSEAFGSGPWTNLGIYWAIFVSKLNSAGDVVWFKVISGKGLTNYPGGISVDTSGNVYSTGYFTDTIYFEPFNLTSAGESDIFISKLDSGGNFVWAKAIGGTSSDGASDISVDTSGNIYTTGEFNGTVDFDPGPGTFNLSSAGGYGDIFVLCLNQRSMLTVSLPGNGLGSVASSPSGINCGSDCNETYNYGTTVTLTATASPDSIFSGWSGACSGRGSCTIQMDRHQAVSAFFVKPVMPPIYKLLLDPEP